jgi:hypothetical protein
MVGQIIIQPNGMFERQRKANRSKFKPEEDEKLFELVNRMPDQPFLIKKFPVHQIVLVRRAQSPSAMHKVHH